MIRVHFAEFELEWHRLEALLSCQHCAPSFQHSYWNYPWWGKPKWKVEVPWLLVEGQREMLAYFVVVIEVASVPRTQQNKQLPDVPFSHNNHKSDPWKECCIYQLLWTGLPQQLQEGRMGVAECTALAFEKECDDLVGVASGG